MSPQNSTYQFLPDGVSFRLRNIAQKRLVYLPLSGVTAEGLKSCITPFLGGDIKNDKNTYVTKPASREDLRQGLRNFFVHIKKKGVFSLTEETAPDSAHIEAGQLWHKLVRRHPQAGIELEALNFIPSNAENVELMRVTVRNISRKTISFTPTAAVPLFARALTNKHDHEHVTSLLHRTQQLAEGVLVSPTMIFNEEGHRETRQVYFVWGVTAKGEKPVGTFPTFENFYSDAGTAGKPVAVYENQVPQRLSAVELNGKEAVGALRFKPVTLKPGAAREYIIMIGTAGSAEEAKKIFKHFQTDDAVVDAWQKTQNYWQAKTGTIEFSTRDAAFDSWMRWVMLQPMLRRIWGCSFLPDHDYGKGGKGWRDLWQDLLSLIMIEPQTIRENLVNNFKGVRIDGSNATIIGSKPGEFVADRNAITRVWMDHGVWPLMTTLLYIHQTGDYKILFENATYFRDQQLSRACARDLNWTPAYGQRLKMPSGQIYSGTILEHILLQNLVQFFNVGEHNLFRLESADWNDGLDMAFRRGESVAFMAMYGGNILALADLLDNLARIRNVERVRLAKEIAALLDTLTASPCNYESPTEKEKFLFGMYFKSVQPEISGEQQELAVKDIVEDLRKKGQWIFEKIRRDEMITATEAEQTFRWFNGYYDNQGQRVEGKKDGHVRMTLTGQVFPIMSGLADSAQVKGVIASTRRFLKDKKLGGYRLNTDFGLRNYLDLGRAFSFAFGTKENGAFFSHMTIMYSYALYKAGFNNEGYEVLQSIYKMCQDSQRAKIYPGIPEYFDSQGRGMYHYLTGSASWLILTELTQAFGVRGEYGDLLLQPKLVRAQFAGDGKASVSLNFAGRRLTVVYVNKEKLDAGQYVIKQVLAVQKPVNVKSLSPDCVKIKRELIAQSKDPLTLTVVLGKG